MSNNSLIARVQLPSSRWLPASVLAPSEALTGYFHSHLQLHSIQCTALRFNEIGQARRNRSQCKLMCDGTVELEKGSNDHLREITFNCIQGE